MERSEYPNLLRKLQPTQAVDVLNDRVRQVGRLNTAIAEWLQERRRLEDQYAAGLRRLARQTVDENDLGIFSVPWGTILSSMDTLADSHSALASKIGAEVERPLRDFATHDRQMTAMTTIQGNLTSIAKDVDKAQQKTDKLQGKSGNANKVADASSDLDNARTQWDSQAPYVFETLQSLDEHRVNQLRDLLTQFQTLEVDQVEKSRVASEQCLNILLNMETQDEIKTFAIKALSTKPRARPMSMMPPTLTPSRAATSSSNNLTPIQSIPDEDSLRSGSGTDKEKKGRLGGLKRLGTVMSRRKDKQPVQLPTMEESPERKKPSPFNSFGRLGRSKDSYGLDSTQEEPSSAQRPRSPVRVGSEVLEPTGSRGQGSAGARASRLDTAPQLNGTSIANASSPIHLGFPNGSHQGDLADLEPPKAVQPEAAQPPPIAEPPKDGEGFSMPPSDLDPISQAQADAFSGSESVQPQFNLNIRNEPIQEEGTLAAAKLQAPPVTTRRAGTVRGRRNDRNSFVVPDYTYNPDSVPPLPSASGTATPPARFEPPVAQSTPSVTNNPHPAASSGGFSPIATSAGAATAVGGAGAAAGLAAFSPTADAQSPLRSSNAAGSSEAAADTQSIRSGRSLSSTSGQALKHPDLHAPGLSSSIIETVSARFEDGKLASSSLIGEIALAYNPLNSSAAYGQETLRIENFSSLEKVAPNPAFLTQTPGKEGEFFVNLLGITKTQLAFKYQLNHDAAETHTPLLLESAFKIEPNQTSVIISYSLHPSFTLKQQQSITLHNVMLALTLDGAKASSCLSKPVGTFAREQNLIYWQLNDVTLAPGAVPGKLLARFTTDSEAKGGSMEAKWEISDESAAGLGSGLAVSVFSSGSGAADPFADEEGAVHGASAWKSVPSVKKLMSGSYVAKS